MKKTFAIAMCIIITSTMLFIMTSCFRVIKPNTPANTTPTSTTTSQNTTQPEEYKGHLLYEIKDTEAVVLGVDTEWKGGVLSIPDNINGYKVTSISTPKKPLLTGTSYYGAEKLKGLIIPETVSNIDLYAFYKCNDIEKITVNENNTHYKSAENCLINIEQKSIILGCKNSKIPSDKNITKIEQGAFDGCNGLMEITIPSNIKTVSACSFIQCQTLENVIIKNGVTDIGGGAFMSCTGLKSVELPKTIKKIGTSAFHNCTALEKVDYKGTEKEFNDIYIKNDNEELTDCYFKKDEETTYATIVCPPPPEYPEEDTTVWVVLTDEGIDNIEEPETVTQTDENSFRMEYTGEHNEP